MKPRFIYAKKRIGAGTAIKFIVNMAAMPLPKRIRNNLRNCRRCNKRERKLDQRFPNINPLAE
jgi:hypothetical protein